MKMLPSLFAMAFVTIAANGNALAFLNHDPTDGLLVLAAERGGDGASLPGAPGGRGGISGRHEAGSEAISELTRYCGALLKSKQPTAEKGHRPSDCASFFSDLDERLSSNETVFSLSAADEILRSNCIQVLVDLRIPSNAPASFRPADCSKIFAMLGEAAINGPKSHNGTSGSGQTRAPGGKAGTGPGGGLGGSGGLGSSGGTGGRGGAGGASD